MLITERQDRILHMLEKDGQVFVSRLSETFHVSEETIRRDLEKLEEEGYARRCYGGATFTGSMDLPFKERKRNNVSAKRRIAAAIAAMIPDGASVAMDESSTATFVAEALKGKKKRLTIITNSMETAILLSDKTEWTVLLTGGVMRHQNLSMTGSKAAEFVRGHAVDWTVISCAGMDSKRGIFDPTEDNAEIKKAMLDAAAHTVLAVDGKKFERRSLCRICPLYELDTVVTDRRPDENWLKAFEENRVELICAGPDDTYTDILRTKEEAI